jgi:transcriptional regulator with XRE-family HTH domain
MHLAAVEVLLPRRNNERMDLKAIGRRARRLRIEKDWTQAELAERAGVTTNTIRGFETGTINTRWPKLNAIVRALGTTVEQLAEHEDVVKPADPMLVGLKREDLIVARAYHDSETPIRQRVMALLKQGESAERGDQQDANTLRKTTDYIRTLIEVALKGLDPAARQELAHDILKETAEIAAATEDAERKPVKKRREGR